MLLSSLVASMTAMSQLKLPAFFGNGMVLQRDQPVAVWGQAAPERDIEISFDGSVARVKSDAEGKWKVNLPSHKAGRSYTLTVKDGRQVVSFKDVLVGDVWLASGQSNMEFKMKQAKDKYPAEIAGANNPEIRQFIVKTGYQFNGPAGDVGRAEWKAVTPETINDFTAVGYFFAKELYRKYGVPVGIILSSVGGTPAEAWMSEEGLATFPHYEQEVAAWKDSIKLQQTIAAEAKTQREWYGYLKQQDSGLAYSSIPWYSEQYQSSDWKLFKLPGFWEEQGMPETDGVVWFRKEIDLSPEQAGKQAVLNLGFISDEDTTYVNGIKAGAVSSRFAGRKYILPDGLLKAGRNVIVIRVINKWNRGGFMPGKEYDLKTGDNVLSLEGDWLYKPGVLARNPLPAATAFQNKPAGLYNGMIAPLIPYAVKGVIWYQGRPTRRRLKNTGHFFLHWSGTGEASGSRKSFLSCLSNWLIIFRQKRTGRE